MGAWYLRVFADKCIVLCVGVWVVYRDPTGQLGQYIGYVRGFLVRA